MLQGEIVSNKQEVEEPVAERDRDAAHVSMADD